MQAQASASKPKLWTARVLSGIVALFMLFDSTIHIVKPAPVVEAFQRLGFPIAASFGIGMIELVCLILYVVPRTAVLGAVLLTGVFGGAIATHMRASSPIFEAYVFPLLLGALTWGGVWLRDDSLRVIFPLRNRRTASSMR